MQHTDKMREAFVAWATRLYNTGYHAGHHDTVEGGYTHVYRQDMDSYHEEVVAEWLTDNPQPTSPARPAQTEQQPLFYINPLVIDELKGKRKPSPGGLTWSRTACGHWTFAVYAAPIAQTAPQPEQSGLVEALEAIVQQYPNPDISHVDYRVHACRQAEQALDAYRAALSAQGGNS